MELIKNIDSARKLIESAIRKHGFTPEHNFQYFKCLQEPLVKNFFFSLDNNMGILAQKHRKHPFWYMISEPLAPKEKRLSCMLEFFDYALHQRKAKKVVVELTESARKELLEALEHLNYRACEVNYILYWPVFSLKDWTGDELAGKKWKKLRNIRNSLFRNHTVKIKTARSYSKEQLKGIVTDWVRKRQGLDRALYERYFNMIDNEFKGTVMTRVIEVDKQPCAISGGWRIPNSNNYYSAIGICNYRFEGLGEVSALDDLTQIKRRGYSQVDFGGSEKALLWFKKKFKPDSIYKTYMFSIVRR